MNKSSIALALLLMLIIQVISLAQENERTVYLNGSSGPVSIQIKFEASHEHLLVPQHPVRLDKEGRILAPELRFRDTWIRDRVIAIEGIEKVSFVDRMVATTSFNGPVKARTRVSPKIEVERWVRVDGSERAVAEAKALIRKVQSLGAQQMLTRVWIVTGEFKKFKPGIKYLDTNDLKSQIESTRKGRGADKLAIEKLPILADLFSPRTTLLTAPSILTNVGQEAKISIMEEIAYIKDFKVERLGKSIIADPVVDVISDGIEIVTAGIVDPRTEKLTLMVDLRISKLTRPIAEFETTLAGMTETVTIQLPEVQHIGIRRKDIVLDRDRGCFCFDKFGCTNPDGSREQYRVFFEVQLIDPETEELGWVMGVDRVTNRAFVKMSRDAKDGRKVFFWRKGKKVGHGILETAAGDFAIVQVKDGSPQQNDHVR